ncbi:hypothetical protein [Rhodanobacter sp. B05]|uniref:hypothetical protein n=1 Tax=Rhodanobacter sp. B05 TaxID=1945859 RepID=UPI0011157113|nr:hypothetical protein [Rhodanobacter sp. B05]
MADLPTTEEAEQEVLKVFDKFGVRPDEMLMLRSLLASWNHNRFRMQDLQDALQSLADSGAIYVKENSPSGSFFLTKEGYARIPSRAPASASIPSASIPAAITISGHNARININSTDNSVNVIQVNETVLDDVISALASLPDQPGREVAVAAAKDLKTHAGKPSFAGKYKDFMSSVSDHVSIISAIAPYLGALAHML